MTCRSTKDFTLELSNAVGVVGLWNKVVEGKMKEVEQLTEECDRIPTEDYEFPKQVARYIN